MIKNYILSTVFLFFSVLSFSQVSVGNGTLLNEEMPIEPYYKFSYSQVIYHSGEINASGTITGLKYTANPATTLENSDGWDIWIGHTSLDQHEPVDGTTNVSWVDINELTQVFSGNVSISDQVVSITLDTPFEYNGEDNLIIAVNETSNVNNQYDSSTHDFYCTATPGVSRGYVYYNDLTSFDPYNPVTTSSYLRESYANITFEGITQSCSNPILSLDNLTSNSASISWNAPDVSNFEYVFQETGGDDPSSGEIITETSIELSDLTQGLSYEFFVRSVCENEVTDWFSISFTPPLTGSIASDPIIIDSIPYSTTDDTVNYGDDYINSATGCNGSGSYLGGDDVVYLYTPDSDASLNVKFTPQGNWNGIYVYENAEDIGVNCWLVNYVSIDAVQTVFDLTVYAGQSYYFVISTYPSPQSMAYSLDISENSCVPPAYETEIVSSCAGGEGNYSVDVNISDLGSSDELIVTDGSETLYIQDAGIYTFGPYNSGQEVTISFDTGDFNCDSTVVFAYTCPPIGSTGDEPILINSLPYYTSDDTINYGDDYTNTATECDGSGFYLGGDDVVYLYQASQDMTLLVTLTPDNTYSGIYVYDSAEDIGTACWIVNSTNSAQVESSFELPVSSGSNYYFVISSFPLPQNISYSLSIEELLCGAPTELVTTEISDISGNVSWSGLDDGTTYLIEMGDDEPTDISESGTIIDGSSYDFNDLNSQTTYTVWLAAVCPDGSISALISTSFTTDFTPPSCGETLTYDYPNSNSGGSLFDDNFDLATNDYSSDLLFSTTAGDQDSDGYIDEVTVTLSGTTENNYDWVFITDGAGNLLYGPVSGPQSGSYTATDGTINIYLAADTSIQGGPVTFDVSCAGLSISDNEISDLRIYPNPVDTDYITIVSSLSGEKFIEIFDVNARKVFSTSISGDILDISSLESGFYITRVTIDGKTSTSKLIIN